MYWKVKYFTKGWLVSKWKTNLLPVQLVYNDVPSDWSSMIKPVIP